MALLKGLMNQSERAILKARGWDLTVLPESEQSSMPGTGKDEDLMCEVFVESNMFEIMDSSEWEGGYEEGHPLPLRKTWRDAVLDEMTSLEYSEWLMQKMNREQETSKNKGE